MPPCEVGQDVDDRTVHRRRVVAGDRHRASPHRHGRPAADASPRNRRRGPWPWQCQSCLLGDARRGPLDAELHRRDAAVDRGDGDEPGRTGRAPTGEVRDGVDAPRERGRLDRAPGGGHAAGDSLEQELGGAADAGLPGGGVVDGHDQLDPRDLVGTEPGGARRGLRSEHRGRDVVDDLGGAGGAVAVALADDPRAARPPEHREHRRGDAAGGRREQHARDVGGPCLEHQAHAGGRQRHDRGIGLGDDEAGPDGVDERVREGDVVHAGTLPVGRGPAHDDGPRAAVCAGPVVVRCWSVSSGR
ncbi:hypothetical protein DEJ27_10240 [Curtobacterium sp. MCPF17_018]|nr:hypothetical protein DEJ27_10240 [Curtobacterium sp. MCPF17_018]